MKECRKQHRYVGKRCPECRRDSQKKWYAANPERRKAQVAAWRAKNPERVRAMSAKWRLANPERAKASTEAWNRSNTERVRYNYTVRRARGYGISVKEYNDRISLPCEICGQRKTMHLDHNHATNKLRGTLCQECNHAIGLFYENRTSLLSAVQYLARYEGGSR